MRLCGLCDTTTGVRQWRSVAEGGEEVDPSRTTLFLSLGVNTIFPLLWGWATFLNVETKGNICNVRPEYQKLLLRHWGKSNRASGHVY